MEKKILSMQINTIFNLKIHFKFIIFKFGFFWVSTNIHNTFPKCITAIYFTYYLFHYSWTVVLQRKEPKSKILYT